MEGLVQKEWKTVRMGRWEEGKRKKGREEEEEEDDDDKDEEDGEVEDEDVGEVVDGGRREEKERSILGVLKRRG